jgi:nucleotide-binding universal stress UspA family protein
MADSRGHALARIVITCDASPLGEAALGAAVALARQLDSELAGLFVENANLLRMAELPFSREVVLAGVQSRRVEASVLERTLRRQAQAVRDALSRVAHEGDLPWSFRVVRGALLDSVLAAMREADLAVFGYAGQYAFEPGTRPATARVPSIGLRQPILVIYDGSAKAARAMRIASALARVHRTEVFVLLAAPDADTARSGPVRSLKAELRPNTRVSGPLTQGPYGKLSIDIMPQPCCGTERRASLSGQHLPRSWMR